MGDGQRTAFCQLLTETGNDGAVAAQHITETGSDKAGFTGLPAFTDSDAQALHIHLCQTFGSSHNVGRVDGFIGRDHDELVYAVFDCHIGHVARAIDIRMDGFAGVLFHKGHMLVGSGMEDQLGMETLVDAFNTVDHADVSHDRGKLDIGKLFFQLQPDVMHRGFGTVEQNQLLQPEMAELAAEFATDGTGGSGNQYDFAFQGVGDLLHVDTDLFAPQEVFDTDFGKGAQLYFTSLEFVDGGQQQHADLLFLAKTDQAFAFFFYDFIIGKKDGLDVIAVHQAVEFFQVGYKIDFIAPYAHGDSRSETEETFDLIG